MVRWILLATTLASLALTVFGPSPGWMLLGIGLTLFVGLATVLAFAQSHIEAGARSEELNTFELEQLRKGTDKPGPNGDAPPGTH